ncbi:MAG TPA: diol dehydratase small subunit [Nocardioides sp.]|jgi:propanediol dehydratase small subunit|uniref:diol dehydratase small subunit n=1 Tax=Nocardioides sp. TaxID=35761 RepID=UPI002E318C5F|nr:diol dehydratase small subunit [Nocardioides sp.]HEX3931323.1 diol dehydratase small subunit [Nocardioides sp.]
MSPEPRRAWSGRDSSELTVEGVVEGRLGPDDIRISPDTLRHQADVARAHGNPQLAANFERAAELAAFDEADVLALYELLRPGRATGAELRARADALDARSAPICAAFVREAATVYERTGLTA